MKVVVSKERNGIVPGAGTEAKKSAQITAKPGIISMQKDGLKVITDLLKEIEGTEDREDAIAKAGIATGYANAMRRYNYITSQELQDIIEVIGQAGEKAADRIEAARRHFLMRAIKRVVGA